MNSSVENGYGRRVKNFCAGVCALAVMWGPAGGLGVARAQESQPPAKQEKPVKVEKLEQTPTIRAAARLVEVSVTVQDKNGNPVKGLKPEDFRLLDQGKEEAIRVFVELNEETVEAPAEASPNTFSNRMETTRGKTTNLSVLLLDALNTPGTDQQVARQRVVDFLGEVQPNDRVALYALGTRLVVLHGFTGDIGPLLAAVRKYKTSPATIQTGSDPGSLSSAAEASALSEAMYANPGLATLANDDWMRTSAQSRQQNFLTIRMRRTIEALEAIAKHLAPIPGRKNLIWVSGGFPINLGLDRVATATDVESGVRVSYEKEIDRAAKALTDANVVVYPVDPRGLANLASFDNSGAVNPRPTPGVDQPFNSQQMAFDASTDTIRTLAEKTGGKAFIRTNDIAGAVRQSMAEARTSYLLGFYPSHGRWKGDFRNLKVEVKQAGAVVRHRRGYFARAETVAGEGKAEEDMRAVLNSPLDATGLGLTVLAEPPPTVEGKTAELMVVIDPANMTLTEENGQWTGAAELLQVAIGGQGQVLWKKMDRVTVDVTREVHTQIFEEGIQVWRTVEIPAGTEQLRLVVRDEKSGLMGSVTVPVKAAAGPAKGSP